jgi:hypothetical protein
MNWPAQDNKRYRGKIDRIYVSRTEGYEVDFYVAHYLKSRNYTDNETSRQVIYQQMDLYPGKAPILRTDMDAWLDKRVTKATK